jgi:hypothetical protein
MNKSSNLFVKAFYSVLIYGGYNCNIRLTCFYIIHDLRQDMTIIITNKVPILKDCAQSSIQSLDKLIILTVYTSVSGQSRLLF